MMNNEVPDNKRRKIISINNRYEKIELLRKLIEIKNTEYKLTKSYDFNSLYDDMEYEYDLYNSFIRKNDRIKSYKQILLDCIFIIGQYIPIHFKFNEWYYNHMLHNIDTYDNIIEKIYDKYTISLKTQTQTIDYDNEITLIIKIISSYIKYYSTLEMTNIPNINITTNSLPIDIKEILNRIKTKN